MAFPLYPAGGAPRTSSPFFLTEIFFWIRTAADQTAGIMPWGQVTAPVAPVPLAGKVPAAEACLRAEALALMSGQPLAVPHETLHAQLVLRGTDAPYHAA